MSQAQQPEDLTPGVQKTILRGPQPAWMDDIRAATKAIEAARLASRSNKLDILAPVPKSVELPRCKARALRVTVKTKRTK